MTLTLLTSLFAWMTVINIGLIILSTFLIIALRQLLYRTHGRIFDLTRENIATITYNWLGTYILLIIVFNLVPYLALVTIQ